MELAAVLRFSQLQLSEVGYDAQGLALGVALASRSPSLYRHSLAFPTRRSLRAPLRAIDRVSLAHHGASRSIQSNSFRVGAPIPRFVSPPSPQT